MNVLVHIFGTKIRNNLNMVINKIQNFSQPDPALHPPSPANLIPLQK